MLQLELSNSSGILRPQENSLEAKPPARNGEANKLRDEDRPVHNWYRFVLSFPPHLVRHYLEDFGLVEGQCVLDPFCGTGTTVVECKKRGLIGIGIEANPLAHLASTVKSDWGLNPDGLMGHAERIAEEAERELLREGIVDSQALESPIPAEEFKTLRQLPEESASLLLTNSISPLPLHKTLVLLEVIRNHAHRVYGLHENLALAKALVSSIGNLHFGPEVGVGPAKKDAPVISSWLNAVQAIADDLRLLRSSRQASCRIYHEDSRNVSAFLKPNSIDAVITSPPYPNEKDYTRTTRLESVILGFIHNKADLQALKRGLLRSNTRTVYKGDDDDLWIADHREVERIAQSIEARRLELGKTSGFERMYPRVTKLYFGGMARHFAELRTVLRPGAYLAYVVGDQASYLQVMIRTGQLLADIAQSLGYEIARIDLFRTRLATATKAQIREEVVVLRWPG